MCGAWSGLGANHWEQVIGGPAGVLVGSVEQGSFFWLQNTEGELMVGGWLQIHQPEVLPPYFAARKKNHGVEEPRA
jgi:hypothetical protein